MKEIEVKILDIDVDAVRTKLLQLGAKKKFEGVVHALAFDFPDQRLKKEGSFLRIRKMGEKTELCFKGKKDDSPFKRREETEVTTNNFETTIEIMKHLGLQITHEGKKNRESYTNGKVNFEIDNDERIPHFLEIEAPTEELVEEYVKKLGYSMNQTNNWSYLDVEKHYKVK